MWSSCSDGNMLRLSLEQRWILLIMTRSSSLFAAQWLLPMSSHESQCFPSWRDGSQFSTSDPAFPFLSTTPIWERGDVNFSSLFRLLTHYPECMWVFFAEPSAIMLISSWLQFRPVTTLGFLTISNADWFRWVIPTCLQEVLHLISGAPFLLLSDDSALELFSVIMVVILVGNISKWVT